MSSPQKQCGILEFQLYLPFLHRIIQIILCLLWSKCLWNLVGNLSSGHQLAKNTIKQIYKKKMMQAPNTVCMQSVKVLYFIYWKISLTWKVLCDNCFALYSLTSHAPVAGLTLITTCLHDIPAECGLLPFLIPLYLSLCAVYNMCSVCWNDVCVPDLAVDGSCLIWEPILSSMKGGRWRLSEMWWPGLEIFLEAGCPGAFQICVIVVGYQWGMPSVGSGWLFWRYDRGQCRSGAVDLWSFILGDQLYSFYVVFTGGRGECRGLDALDLCHISSLLLVTFVALHDSC